MKEREKLEMVKMCVDALLEGKPLEYLSQRGNGWKDSRENIAVIADNILADTEYRIAKPAVKWRYRVFKYFNAIDGFGIETTTNPHVENVIQNAEYFRGWLGDWQEVEIEE